MNLRLAQNDNGEFFTIHTVYTGTFTIDIDVYDIKGKEIEGTFWTNNHTDMLKVINKYTSVPKEIMDSLFIEITIDVEVNKPKVWSGL